MSEKPIDDLISNERMDWLRTLGCATRAALAYPFEHEIGGHRYIVATDGTAITALAAMPDERTARRFERLAKAVSLLDGVTWHKVEFLVLWRWLMAWERRCPSCGGLGFQSQPELAAFDRNGDGPATELWQSCGCINPGRMLGVLFDKRRLLTQIGVLSSAGSTIEIAGKPDATAVMARSGSAIDGAPHDWLIVVLGLRNLIGPCNDKFEIGQ